MQDKNFDTILKRTLRNKIDGQGIPPGVKDRVGNNLGLNSKGKKTARFKFVPAVAAGLIILILLAGLSISGPASAINIKLLERLSFFMGDTIHNVTEDYGEESSSTPEPPPPPETTSAGQLTIEEVKDKLPFLLQTPSYLPEDAELKDLKLTGNDSFKIVTMRYTTPKGSLIINIKGNIEEGGSGIMYDEDDAVMENVEIHGSSATLLINKKSGKNNLRWYKQGVLYNITGHYPPEEIIKIAKSFLYKE